MDAVDTMALARKLQSLRKEKGYSQEELAGRLSISRQAVSKWESGQSVPDIDNLMELARIYGVTVDSILNSGSAAEDDPPALSAETPDGGRYEGDPGSDSIRWETERGVYLREPGHYEYRSKRTWRGLPLVHINLGWNLLRQRVNRGYYRVANSKAKGVLAIGNVACGLLSLGFVSAGLLSVGLVSVGLLSIGLVVAGLAAIGGIAAGALAIGGVALGLAAIGGCTAGILSIGGIAAGVYAEGGVAAGTQLAIGNYADGPIAIGVHVTGEYTLVGESMAKISAGEARALILQQDPHLPKWLLEMLLRTFKLP